MIMQEIGDQSMQDFLCNYQLEDEEETNFGQKELFNKVDDFDQEEAPNFAFDEEIGEKDESVNLLFQPQDLSKKLSKKSSVSTSTKLSSNLVSEDSEEDLVDCLQHSSENSEPLLDEESPKQGILEDILPEVPSFKEPTKVPSVLTSQDIKEEQETEENLVVSGDDGSDDEEDGYGSEKCPDIEIEKPRGKTQRKGKVSKHLYRLDNVQKRTIRGCMHILKTYFAKFLLPKNSNLKPKERNKIKKIPEIYEAWLREKIYEEYDGKLTEDVFQKIFPVVAYQTHSAKFEEVFLKAGNFSKAKIKKVVSEKEYALNFNDPNDSKAADRSYVLEHESVKLAIFLYFKYEEAREAFWWKLTSRKNFMCDCINRFRTAHTQLLNGEEVTIKEILE